MNPTVNSEKTAPETKQDPVSVHINRIVRPGREAEFEAALRDFLPLSMKTPGQMGVHIIRPAPGSDSRDYGIIRLFANAAARDDFYASSLFHDWEDIAAPLCEPGFKRQDICGLETWFTPPGQRAVVPPPRSKMAVVTFMAVYPAGMLVSIVSHPFIGDWPLFARAFINSAAIVVLLAWVIMPRLTRWLHRWLYPAP